MRQILREEMKKYRRLMTLEQRITWYSLPQRKMQYPFLYEKQMYARFRNFFELYTKRVYKFIEKGYPRVFLEYNALEKKDSFETEYSLFLRELQIEIEEDIQKGSILFDLSTYMKRITAFILTFNEEEFAAYMKSWTGKALYGTTEWWDDLQRSWMGEMSRSVLNNLTAYEEAIRSYVFTAIKNRTSYEEILSGIKALNVNLSEKRAIFLARDLTGKLNGKIEERLQTSLGIPGYLWQTAADEKVRGRPGGKYPNAIPSHWAIDSMTCKWNDRSVFSLDYGRNWVPRTPIMPTTHPGEDWQCRCVAPPSGFSLAREIDKELEGEENGKTS